MPPAPYRTGTGTSPAEGSTPGTSAGQGLPTIVIVSLFLHWKFTLTVT